MQQVQIVWAWVHAFLFSQKVGFAVVNVGKGKLFQMGQLVDVGHVLKDKPSLVFFQSFCAMRS